MTIKKGFKFEVPQATKEEVIANQIASEFTRQLNLFHSQPSPRDSKVDLYLHQCYADVLRRRASEGFGGIKGAYFSPSSSGSCPRELYLKIKGAERDAQQVQAHQTRWQHIGTKIGDMIQEQVLLMENHLEELTGEAPRFQFLRNNYGEPMFEEFAYKTMPVHDSYFLTGTTDGIMEFTLNNGEKIKVGLEIKSKQTTYAQTGGYSMRTADPKHILQTVAYSLMYDVDYWIILYVNGSKKSWTMNAEDIEKYPDIRAFGHYVTPEMQNRLLEKFDGIIRAVETNEPPKLDLTKWTFNNYKKACALDLTQEEYVELIDKGIELVNSNIPPYLKKSVENALEYIDREREQ